MKINKLILLLSIFFLAVEGLNAGELYAQSQPPSPVVVIEVKEKELQKPITLTGTVEPSKRSLIASEVAGLIKSYPVNEGDFVNRGDIIAVINTDVLNINLEEAKASKREAFARLQLARKNMQRLKQLYDKGIASLQQMQDAESERDAWTAKISVMESKIRKQEHDLRVSKILAPFGGYITSEHTEVGQWIDEGGAVAEIIDIDDVEIVVDVPERYITHLSHGDKSVVELDALPQTEIQGQIKFIVPQADKAARTFPVKVVVKNPDHIIKSGMVARVSFLIGEPSLVKLVPKDAIVEQNNKNFVYVVSDGSVQPVPVTKGIPYKDLIQVVGPINTGQLVVIRGNERLKPGQPVKIVNQDGVIEGKK